MIAGIFDEFFGVATHPLAVHAPVVLVPLLAIVCVVAFFRSSWRERLTIPLAPAAFAMVVMLFVAKESGEALLTSDSVILLGTQSSIDRHQDLAEQSFILAIVWFVLTAAAAIVAVINRRGVTQSLSAGAATVDRSQVVLVLNVLATVALVVTTVWLIRTGHAGAESRWTV